MTLESEYFPAQTSRLNSLSPAERGTYKKILWGVFGVYAVAVAITGVVVVTKASLQKGDDVIAMTRTLPP